LLAKGLGKDWGQLPALDWGWEKLPVLDWGWDWGKAALVCLLVWGNFLEKGKEIEREPYPLQASRQIKSTEGSAGVS
jgi:hypothetical protein